MFNDVDITEISIKPFMFQTVPIALRAIIKPMKAPFKGKMITYKFCYKCQIYRPPMVIHCRDCNRCICKQAINGSLFVY